MILQAEIFPFAITSELVKRLFESQKKAKEEKDTYTKKLERAQGDDVFKYVLLMNSAALEDYIVQTRIQAQQSFNLARHISLFGFILLIIGIGISVYSLYDKTGQIDSAYIAVVSGVLVEFISGVFFYLFNRTTQQINRFHDRLISSQNIAMAFLASSSVSDQTKKDDSRIALSKLLISGQSNTSESPKLENL